ncbi:MAG TPA: DUF1127 domain-containing protein [Alphaproteobacteria bacterium]
MPYDRNQEFTALPNAGYRLTARDKALIARGESIAEFVTGVAHAVRAVAKPLYTRIKNWAVERATRDELTALDDRTLADIGLTRGDIPRVAAGLWVPENRLTQVRAAAPRSPSNVNRPQIAA